jgi:chromate transporter
MLYAAFGKLPAAEALMMGVKAAVLAIVVEALLRIARRGLKVRADQVLAAAAFVAIFFFAIPFPLIVLAAAIYGFLRSSASTLAPEPAPLIPLGQTMTTAALWLAVWIAPLLGIAMWFGSGHVLSQIGLFFSKLAVVTFGGAYAVLAYMAQDVVQHFGWLSAGEMVDGLGLAETTPGPLILVTEFVGFLASFRHGGGNPWALGVLGAIITLWATFAPCFLWIFVGAPYIEWLRTAPRLQSALAAVTAAVVGVILNLTVWFALHVLFVTITETLAGPLRLYLPQLSSLSWDAVGLSALAVLLLFKLHRSIIETLSVCAVLSLALYSVGLA